MDTQGKAAPPPAAGGGQYLRRSQVADRLRISVRTVERWALVGSGPPFVMLGRIPIYPLAELDAWMRARLVTSTAAVSVAKATASARSV